MKPILIAGTIIVQFALLFYTIFIIYEHKRQKAAKPVLFFVTIGVVVDIIATVCMIIGSENSPFSAHGILGYSSLTAMFVDAVLIWQYKMKNGAEAVFTKGLNIYSKIAYSWWVLAYITGAILVFSK